MSAVDGLLFANGVDATTGGPLLAPMTVESLARLATSAPADRADAELAARHRRATEQVYAPKQGVDPTDLAQTGWGVVFAEDADPRIVTALTPMLERRHAQADALVEGRYHEFVGADGYRAGESKSAFLRRHHSGPGPVDPDVIPYYLLLVGGPDEIPFEIQYQLDVQHAVGRIPSTTLPAMPATPRTSSRPKPDVRALGPLGCPSSPLATTTTLRRL